MASKLEDGDFKGAIWLACSDDRLAPFNSATLAALQENHPVPHPDTVIPPTPNPILVQVDPVSVARAIRSFPSGSAGGPDRLRPQHLRYLFQTAGDEESRFLQSLASFCALVIEGIVPAIVCPFFFGAGLVAMEKSGGVRPIAVGCTLRRLRGVGRSCEVVRPTGRVPALGIHVNRTCQETRYCAWHAISLLHKHLQIAH